ncbi:thioredoxin domain-containing protein [Rhodococcus jostii]|uniref:thioredoxin domain-containing protein n=1 Tax=Rhodococcus jostii TaxID=132919 RepID=UPI0036379A0F
MSTNKKKPSPGFIEAHDRRERRRALAIRTGVTALIVGLILAIGIAIVVKRSHQETATPTVVPSAFTPDGGLTFGNPDAPVTVSVTEDFQCPACRQFETTSGPVLTELMNAGQILVDDHPIAFLDRASSTQYSTRAANAAACVAQIDRDKWPAWKAAMFDAQPEEGGTGLTDDQIVAIAAQVGITSPDLAPCITDQTYADWVTTTTNTAMNGIPGTPYVTVNGKPVTDISPDGIRAAITAAQ